MNNKKIYIINIIILILLFFIIKFYFKHNDEYTILQVFLKDIKNNDILYEKYPILIYDKVLNINDILKSLFSYNYLYKKDIDIVSNNINYNKSKYIIIYPDKNCVIDLISPKYKNKIKNTLKESDEVQFVSIKLEKNQILIIPAWWYYNSSKNIKVIELNDILSYFIKTII